MKNHLFTVAAIGAILSLTSWAEEHAQKGQPAPGAQRKEGTARDTTPLRMLVKASDIIGLEVRNYQDEKLGKIEDLVVDVGPDRITGLLVGVGGILGVGDKPVVVPMSAFHYDSDKKLLHLDSTKDALKAAPRFEIGKWTEFQYQ